MIACSCLFHFHRVNDYYYLKWTQSKYISDGLKLIINVQGSSYFTKILPNDETCA